MIAAESRRRPASVPTDDEVRALISKFNLRYPTSLRNAALVVLMWRGGLRIAEALSLIVSDVDLARGAVQVRHGKGDRSRWVGVDEKTCDLLARWIDRRASLGLNGGEPLFCTLKGGALDQAYVRKMVKRKAEAAGIERRMHPHGLRHAYAAGLAQEGVPINVIRDALGHSSLMVTDRYLRDVAPVQLIETTRARSW